MKKYLKYALISALAFNMSCNKDDGDPTINPPADSTGLVTLEGQLTSQTLDASKKYLLKGQVFVNEGITLTIPAGTVIFGEKKSKATLIINKGGKLMAEGTAESPIVFTSALEEGARDRGDWGGIIILGNANVNQNEPSIEGISPAVSFGTFNSNANDADNSGVLKYVRIEYAGIELTPNNETNSLTLGGVGNGTVIDYVQTSFGGDDAFEWFGGTVNANHLVSLSTWDDDFDTDFGYSGKVQYALAVRNAFYADQSGSNAFESDNDASGSSAIPQTSAVFSNVTVLGPKINTKTSISGNYQHAMHLRRNSALSIVNSVFTGFPTLVRLDGTQANYSGATGVLANNLIIAVGDKDKDAVPYLGKATTGDAVATEKEAVKAYWEANGNTAVITPKQANTDSGTPANEPDYAAAGIDKTLYFSTIGTYGSNPNFAVSSGTITSGASFSNPKVASGFENTTFIGAFGTTDWTDGWSEFSPINKQY